MRSGIFKAVTPLTETDCLTVLSTNKKSFDSRLYFHEEYELNFISNGKGIKRIVGNSVEFIEGDELVLIAPGVIRGWFSGTCSDENIKEIKVLFHKDFFDEKFLHKSELVLVRNMLELSNNGIIFNKKITEFVSKKLLEMKTKKGFMAVLDLMSVLNDLSVSEDVRLIQTNELNRKKLFKGASQRLELVKSYINENAHKNITLLHVSKQANMAEVSFSRFFKNETGVTFSEYLINLRLSNVTKMLSETQKSIAEIAYHCGFNNLSYFNRIFKSKRGCTPNQFREEYYAVKKVIA
jgi:AraC-like DNA-binding protein